MDEQYEWSGNLSHIYDLFIGPRPGSPWPLPASVFWRRASCQWQTQRPARCCFLTFRLQSLPWALVWPCGQHLPDLCLPCSCQSAQQRKRETRDEIWKAKWGIDRFFAFNGNLPLFKESLGIDHAFADGRGFPRPVRTWRVHLVELWPGHLIIASNQKRHSKWSHTSVHLNC